MGFKFGDDIPTKYPARRFQSSERFHTKKDGQTDATEH